MKEFLDAIASHPVISFLLALAVLAAIALICRTIEDIFKGFANRRR